MVTRRRLLAVSGSIGVGVLAGCLGDGDADDETSTPKAHDFAHDELVFTTERAADFGEYTPVDEATYRVGDHIWIYIEVENVTPQAEGDHLETVWELSAPDGAVLERSEESLRLPESLEEPPNSAYITQGIFTGVIEIEQSGEHTIDVTITDVGSGESVSVSEVLTIERLAFDTVVFTDGEPRGFDDYDEAPDATYDRGETVWVYTAVEHVPVDDADNAELEYTFEVTDPDGEQWEPIEHLDSWEDVAPDDILARWQPFATYSEDPLGTYELTITIEDGVAGHVIESTETFELE